jgi:hypothetical protein
MAEQAVASTKSLDEVGPIGSDIRVLDKLDEITFRINRI